MSLSVTPRGRGRTVYTDHTYNKIDLTPIPCKLTQLCRIAKGRVEKSTNKDSRRTSLGLKLHSEQFTSYLRVGFSEWLNRRYRRAPLGACLGLIKDPVSKQKKLYIKDHFSGVIRPKRKTDDLWNAMPPHKLEERRREWLQDNPPEPNSDDSDIEDDYSEDFEEYYDDVDDNKTTRTSPPTSEEDDDTEDGDDPSDHSDHDDDGDSGDQNDQNGRNNGGDGDGDNYDGDDEDDDEENGDSGYSSDSSNQSNKSNESDESDTRRDTHCYNPTWVSRPIVENNNKGEEDPTLYDLETPPIDPKTIWVRELKAEFDRQQTERRQREREERQAANQRR